MKISKEEEIKLMEMIVDLDKQIKRLKIRRKNYKEQLEAINYTHSCTELKDKEVLSFEEWLFVNNYKKLFDYFVKDSISFTESELMQIYNDKVMSL